MTKPYTGLLRAGALLVREIIGIGICLMLALWGAHVLYRLSPNRTELASGNRNSVDFAIVEKQLIRITNAVPASVAFFGDSSCLMGVEPQLLERFFHDRTVSSYCMLAYVGPVGYATAIRRLIEIQRPDNMVIMLHPIQFRRYPSWESWPAFVENWTPTRTPTQRFPTAGLDYVRLNLLGPALFEPLPGAYGLFYGGEAQLVQMIDEHNGGAIDPGIGLDQRSLADEDALARAQDISYERNDAFRAALSPLRDVVRDFGPTHVVLVISPVPDSNFSVAAQAQRNAAGLEITSLLGLSRDSFVETPATLPTVYFASQTHLTRLGKQRYTQALAKALAPLLH